MLRKTPAVRERMRLRGRVYNRAVDFIENPPEDCTLRVIAPDENFQVGRTTRDGGKTQGRV